MILENVPTIVEIKKAIPKRCFEKSMNLSFYYVLRDISYAFSSYMILLGLEGCIENSYVLIKAGVYIGYWILQGTIFAGIFCLGHDCGHGSFSNNGILNDTVGNILHTFILAPYYPWKLSHRVHHKNTNNIDKDEVFYPIRENQDNPRKKDSLLKNLPFFAFGFGWFGYVVKGYGPNGRNISHLNPINKHFKGHYTECFISLILMILWTVGPLRQYYIAFGIRSLLCHYLMPVFGFGCWIVLITFLHHHDDGVPWFSNEEWSYVKGQLCSIDRHYGWAHDILHSIGTHQIHHLFPQIPHYHLEEATRVFRQKYPNLIRCNTNPIVSSYFKGCIRFNRQEIIKNNTAVHVFKDKKD
ncbi:uncharacterized protein [Lepeophtheirus salmonis]|uniref:uncharacterized protein n=1 Tax=Lepeophtheirus salmonis TaxID=72036 RepID=UPI001AE8B3E5|nr:fatty acid desaturase DES3-like [Lepeophtheirus salmonis]